MKCTRCGGEEFRKDGTIKYESGTKQRLKCKQCGKVRAGEWLSFDKVAYDKHKKEEFKEFQEHKQAYEKAKKESGWGGFRMDDL